MIKKIITFIINLLTKTFDYLTSLGTTNNALIYKPDVKKLIEPDTLKALKRDSTTRREYGESLVIVTSHGGSCELCKKWEKKILLDDVFTKCKSNSKYPLLSDAIKDGLFHKGCRHTISTYYSELERIKYDKEE